MAKKKDAEDETCDGCGAPSPTVGECPKCYVPVCDECAPAGVGVPCLSCEEGGQMGNREMLEEMLDELEVQERADLSAGRMRVVDLCHTCPFGSPLPEKSGSPKIQCEHPATWVPPEPLKVEVGEDGRIPHNCPLKVQPITVFLDPKEDR